MRSIRIHSSRTKSDGPIQFLLLQFLEDEQVMLNFGGALGAINGTDVQAVVSERDLYAVLSGKDTVVQFSLGSIELRPRELELYLQVTLGDETTAQEFSVWMSEVALGWNLMSQAARA